jgi:hypothetical protein
VSDQRNTRERSSLPHYLDSNYQIKYFSKTDSLTKAQLKRFQLEQAALRSHASNPRCVLRKPDLCGLGSEIDAAALAGLAVLFALCIAAAHC